jgi:hypothetical protein
MTGFEKLRLAAKKTVAVAAVAAGLTAMSASAVPVNINKGYTVKAGGASWLIGNYVAGATFTSYNYYSSPSSTSTTTYFSNGFGIEDAAYAGKEGAFSGALTVRINGVQYQDPDGVVDVSSTGSGITVKGDEMLLGRPRTAVTPLPRFNPVAVKASYYFSKKAPLVRAIYTLRNPAASSIQVGVEIRSLFANGFRLRPTVAPATIPIDFFDYRVLIGTGNGNTVFESALDRYVVVSDVRLNVVPVTTFRYGAGAVIKPAEAYLNAPGVKPGLFKGTQGLNDYYFLTIPAGKTVSIMVISLLNPPSNSAALATAKDSRYASLLTLLGVGATLDVPVTDLQKIINWKL